MFSIFHANCWQKLFGCLLRMSFTITLAISLHGWTGDCHAQSIFTWNDFAGDFYDIGNNWTPNGPPGSNDIARFGQTATYNVLWDSITSSLTPDVGSVEVLLGNVTFLNQDLTRHNFEINDSLSVTGSSTQLTISGLGLLVNNSTLVDGGGSLEIDGSHVAGSALAALGSLEVLQGTVTFSNGATGDLLGDLNLNVDSAGTAEFNVTNGSDVDFEALHIGNGGSQSSSSLGTLNISGVGSSMVQFPPATASVVIGNTSNLGSHALNVTDGGFFVGNNNTIVNDSGNLNVVAGQYNIGGDMVINGAMSIQQGGSVSSQQGIIAQNAGDSVNVNIKGSGSQWNNSGNLTIGIRGNGNLDVGANALVTSSNATIAERSTSNSRVNVFEGSTWNNAGQMTIGKEGVGTLNISSNGVVTSNGSTIGSATTSTGTVNVDGNGSRWTDSSIVTVGDAGSGALNITDGGVVEFGETIFGESNNSTGTVLASGSDSRWDSGAMIIGDDGTGGLTISNLAQVNSGNVRIGNRSDSFGSAIMSGAAEWNTGSIGVGISGSGELLLESGQLNSSATTIAMAANSAGSVLISGAGSQWDNSGFLDVGSSGSGSLVIRSGATVSNASAGIGFNSSNGIGVATVAGFGTQWVNAGNLIIGTNGTGTLNIQAGALVRVDGQTSVGNNGVVNISGGRFEFGRTVLSNFDRINATGGAARRCASHGCE